jgi:hypothetical protein
MNYHNGFIDGLTCLGIIEILILTVILLKQSAKLKAAVASVKAKLS